MDARNKKICVYAICKNEEKNVSKWIESMSEADYIVVLDTGSSDKTVELLRADPRVTCVKQKVYDNWRFDHARNDALVLVPKDTTIYVSTDIDELFEPGWATVLRNTWQEDTTRAWYTYVWSHNESGLPGRIFSQNKIHGASYKWIYPVHEQLLPISGKETPIDLTSKITLHHWPKAKESRNSYLSLLELRLSEDDGSDKYGCLYLTHEYYYHKQYDKCIELGTQLLNTNRFSTFERSNIILFVANSLRDSGKLNESVGYYFDAIETDPQYREPYCVLAAIFNNKQQWKHSILLLETASKLTTRRYSWLEQDTVWSGELEDLLSIAYYYIGEYEKGYIQLLKAMKLDPDNMRYKTNMPWFKDKLDIQ